MKKQVMKRAWELKRLGYAEFATCLRDAWAEARGTLTIVLDAYDIETAEEVEVISPLDLATRAMFRVACRQPLKIAG